MAGGKGGQKIKKKERFHGKTAWGGKDAKISLLNGAQSTKGNKPRAKSPKTGSNWSGEKKETQPRHR